MIAIEPPLDHRATRNQPQPLTAYLDDVASPADHPVFGELEEAVARLRQAAPAMSEEFAHLLARRCTKRTSDGWTWCWDARLRTRSALTVAGHEFTPKFFTDLLADLPVPVSLLFGTYSALGRDDPRRRIAKHAAECLAIAGGHNLTLEAADEVAAAIARAASPASAAAKIV
jgi:pimeloyl-ACP methyl ester carboxylesterase